MHDLDHHLARRDAPENLLAQGPFLDLGDEVLDHRQRDIGLQERDPDVAHGGVDIGLLEDGALLQAFENVAQTAG